MTVIGSFKIGGEPATAGLWGAVFATGFTVVYDKIRGGGTSFFSPSYLWHGTVFFIPLGIVIGSVIGIWVSKRPRIEDS